MLRHILAATCLSACAVSETAEQSADAHPAETQETKETVTMIMDDRGFTEPAKLYEIEFTSINGDEMPFRQYKGQVVLVVNTASKCGYTPQYAGLQELHDTFSEQGLVVLGVPSNDFGAQEPGTEDEVKSFCEINYGVTFPLTKKYAVSGDSPHPFYQVAQETLGEAATPQWNFHKVLVGRDGKPIAGYPSATKPADAELVADIERALGS